VLSCLTFVLSIALEYRRWGVPFEDIVQQGNLGLLRAAKKFNPDKECRLATYAAYWIRAEIREYVVRACRVALLGLSERERWIVRRRMMSEEPTTLQEICGLLGVSKERVRQLEERAKAKLRGALFEMREEAPFA
jgi:RNA polymerase sigma-32 factor